MMLHFKFSLPPKYSGETFTKIRLSTDKKSREFYIDNPIFIKSQSTIAKRKSIEADFASAKIEIVSRDEKF
jgi:hypothetical protein